MGYNTPVLLYNDSLHLLRDDEEAGRKLYDAVSETRYNRAGAEYPIIGSRLPRNYGVILHSAHADETRLIAAGQNSMVSVQDLYYAPTPRDEEEAVNLLKKAADKYGYRLVKKPKK